MTVTSRANLVAARAEQHLLGAGVLAAPAPDALQRA